MPDHMGECVYMCIQSMVLGAVRSFIHPLCFFCLYLYFQNYLQKSHIAFVLPKTVKGILLASVTEEV